MRSVFFRFSRTRFQFFSLEECTITRHWWSENPEVDPWKWRAIITRRGEVAYGRFFDGKVGFISKEWLSHIVNYRGDGYDFDTLWDDGKAYRRQKKIMDLFAEDNEESEFFLMKLRRMQALDKMERRALIRP